MRKGAGKGSRFDIVSEIIVVRQESIRIHKLLIVEFFFHVLMDLIK